MSQSHAMNWIHLVYSTKNRQPLLDKLILPKLFAFQAGIFKKCDSPALIINGVDNHLHALFNLSKNECLAKVIEEVKRSSSKWMKTQGTLYKNFSWQNGYGAFSVSASDVPQVRKYIGEQEKHHRKMDYKIELETLLQKYEVEYDPRYLWS
jgi:REP element-mobilizing transposase RayT